MANNKKIVAYILGAGSLLLPLGLVLYYADHLTGAVLYALGVAMFAVRQALQPAPDTTRLTTRQRTQLERLQRLQWVAILLMALSATAMIMQLWDYSHGTFLFWFAHRNAWLPLLLAGALVLLYTSLRTQHLTRQMGLAVLMTLPLLTGCQSTYLVDGSTNIHGMEGQMLYLKIYKDYDLQNLDSARVMHGKFQFEGTLDSVVMANLFVGDQSVMPIVIEGTPLTLKLNEVEQNIEGSELNDSLCQFIHRKSQIDSQMAELPRKEGRMVMDGMDIDEVARLLNIEFLQLQEQSDQIVVDFIKRNYHNVLGPGIFMIMTSDMPIPVMTPRIEEIMATAPDIFKESPYVKEFLKRAQKNSQ